MTATGQRALGRIDEADWAAATAAIGSADTVLLACHQRPDGDALGSMLAAGQGLERLGVRVRASFPAPFELPDTLSWLSGQHLLVPPEQAPAAPDLLITFDAGSADRIGELAARLADAGSSLVVDHHASNTRFGTVSLVDADAAATGVLVDELLRRLGVPLTRPIAECLYVAVSTDTGSFQYQATTAAVHRLAARLLDTGIAQDQICRRLYESRPFGSLAVQGAALSRTELDTEAAGRQGLVTSYVTLSDLATHGQRGEVMETVVDLIRTAAEAEVACVAKQLAVDEWAVSLRSKGGVDVSRVAVALGGGGHRFAAGFTGHGEVAAVLGAVRAGLAAAVAPPD